MILPSAVSARILIVLLVACCLAVALAALAGGAMDLSIARILTLLSSPAQPTADYLVVWQIRLPRIVLGLMVGAVLAMSGAVMQGLFRNPLADPGLIGVSSGALLAAACVIVLGGPAFLGPYALPLSAFAGSLVITMVIWRIGTRAGVTSVATVLLAGIAINAIAGAANGLLHYISDDDELRELTFWTMGSLSGAGWTEISVSFIFMLIPLLALPLLAPGLNLLSLGENAARHGGLNVEWLKRAAVVLVALGIGAAVSLSGLIGFIGLVVPHLLRLIIGPDHRWLLPASGLLGAGLLVGADLVARTLIPPEEIPIGLLTTAMGGPVFLWLLLRRNAAWR